MTILILGASGLVGSHCLGHLLSDDRFDKVIALLRKPLPVQHTKLQQVIVDFDRLDEMAEPIRADAVVSMMGTTRKKAGSAANFSKVDHDYQLHVAEIALRNGARSFVLLSSMGANKKSPILYPRVKGEVEDDISKLGYDKVVILRPSLLVGERKESRPAEAIGQWIATKISFIFSGPLAKYKPINADTVALAMVSAVLKPVTGIHIVENLEIFEWAKN